MSSRSSSAAAAARVSSTAAESCAVLLEEPVEQVAPPFQFREPCGIVLHFLRIVGRQAGKLIEVGERGVEQLAPRCHGGIRALERA